MENNYIVRHVSALDEAQRLGFDGPTNPKKIMEQAIVHACAALRHFGEGHRALYESPIGEDGVLGNYWLGMARALVGMLNGESGRLDCGTVDGSIRDMAREFGFTETEADTLEPDKR